MLRFARALPLLVGLACVGGSGCAVLPLEPPPPKPPPGNAADLAFPTALGYGAPASGGRGGRVLRVTHLQSAGPGSFREAVRTRGPRVVVFEVAGNIPIDGQLRIPYGDLTIACQSAPGGGVSFVGGSLVFGELDDETPYESQRHIKARNIVIRHCRSRDPSSSVRIGDNADGFQFLNVDLAILDHVSIAWAADESGATRRSRRVTWQNCLITEPLIHGRHSKGPHPYGPMASYGTQQWSMIGCFLSNGWHRFPHMIGNNLDRGGRRRGSTRLHLGPPHPVFLFAGNTVYNVGGPEGIGGSEVAIGAHAVIEHNDYWRGPDTLPGWLPIRGHDRPESAGSGTSVRLSGNRLEGVLPARQGDLIAARFRGVPPPAEAASRWGAPEPNLELTAGLASVGALPHDEIDARVLREFRARTGRQGAPWRKAGDPVPEPAPGERVRDRDRDGMPDAWETGRDRDPDRYDPWEDRDCNGWADLEDYLNERAGDPRVAAGC